MNTHTQEWKPFVSIIVPVLNNKLGLKLCCQALASQSYPRELYEVIIVDNGSIDGSLSVVSEFKDFVSTHESQIGSYAARNKGIDVSKGSILAFTDSDCIPDVNWISDGISFLSTHQQISAIGGKIKLIFSSDSPNIYEIYDSIFRLNQENYINNFNFAATANFFIRTEVINKCGRFSASLKSGGDVELCHRLLNNGHSISYAANVLISHPAQNSMTQIVKREIRYYNGLFEIEKRSNNKFNSDYLLKKKITSLARPIKQVFSRSNTSTCARIGLLAIGAVNKFVCLFERIRLSLGGRSCQDL